MMSWPTAPSPACSTDRDTRACLQSQSVGLELRRQVEEGVKRVRRGDLTDEQWQRLLPLLPAQRPKTGRPGKDHRTIIDNDHHLFQRALGEGVPMGE